jgi:hypothetical protein
MERQVSPDQDLPLRKLVATELEQDPGRREPPTRAVKNRERQGNDGRGKVDGEEDD